MKYRPSVMPSYSISHRIDDEERLIDDMIQQAVEGSGPGQWPSLLRLTFAQAVFPAPKAPPGKLPTLGIEHAKGLKLYRHFYPGRMTIESLPAWVTKASRDPALERSAERVRHNLVRRLEMERTSDESGQSRKAGSNHRGYGA